MRFFAAMLVMMYHANWIHRPGLLLTSLGHEGVVIFFVLSGFVIAYVADTREQDFREFHGRPGARIFSVAIPAIFLTAGLDASGFWLEPAVYPQDYRAWDLPLVRMISSALFLNEIWILGIQLFTNVPYWSLNYEVWYYVMFGVLVFIPDRKRWLLFALLCLFVWLKDSSSDARLVDGSLGLSLREVAGYFSDRGLRLSSGLDSRRNISMSALISGNPAGIG
ncbi:MAG: acyltransferase family protein [Halioglobus sp.]|nr:acyltransferase family protein [Halioglobus sp.]